MKSLKPVIDFKKQPYAEPKFMLPPDTSKLPVPFSNLMKTAELSNYNTKWLIMHSNCHSIIK